MSLRENRHTPPNFEGGNFFGSCEPINRPLRNLQVVSNFLDGEDLAFWGRHNRGY